MKKHWPIAHGNLAWWLTLDLTRFQFGFQWNPSGNNNPRGRWDAGVSLGPLYLIVDGGRPE